MLLRHGFNVDTFENNIRLYLHRSQLKQKPVISDHKLKISLEENVIDKFIFDSIMMNDFIIIISNPP